jgi:hypothetical protein
MKKILVYFNEPKKLISDLVLFEHKSYYYFITRFYHKINESEKTLKDLLTKNENLQLYVNDFRYIYIEENIYQELLNMKLKDIILFNEINFFRYCKIEENLI